MNYAIDNGMANIKQQLIHLYLTTRKPTMIDLTLLCNLLSIKFDKYYIGRRHLKRIIVIDGFECTTKKQALLTISNIHYFYQNILGSKLFTPSTLNL